MSVDKADTEHVIDIIKPDWPAADNVHAFCTTRNEGLSLGDYAGLNLALHVEDETQRVLANRVLLKQQFQLPDEPVWLNQVHGNRVVNAQYIKSNQSQTLSDADASFSETADKICTVMTADCLPILISNRKGTKVAAIHAGWRGLADGVIESTVVALNERYGQLLIWLGPAIGAQAFEVGEEVRDIFISNQATSIDAFKKTRPGHYLADIYLLAKLRLENMGIRAIYGGEYCTYTDANRFYSFRRDGKTGRQASMIWFE